jgi:hypothetical protein
MSASAILLVTWFVAGQRPDSYQVHVTDCAAAKTAIEASATSLRGSATIPPPPPGFVMMPSPKDQKTWDGKKWVKAHNQLTRAEYPKVSAVCVDAQPVVDWRDYFKQK